MAGGRRRWPSQVDGDPSWFDRFAEGASRVVSRAWFFAACVLMVLAWAPSYPLFGTVDTYQLVINTGTTIVTFLLVALIQNSQRRSDQATQHKLNAVAAALAAVMNEPRLDAARRELCAAVGLEEHESA
jgi:low affinity Fe/Cu permease